MLHAKTIISPDEIARFEEPQAEWVPLDEALFHCASGKFSRIFNPGRLATTLERLAQAVEEEVPPPNFYLNSRPRWKVDGHSIATPGIITDFLGRSIYVLPSNHIVASHLDFAIIIRGYRGLDKTWDVSCWDDIPDFLRAEAEWHRYLLFRVLRYWHAVLAESLKDGDTHIVARKGVLGPFELVPWDQWQYFQVHEFVASEIERVWDQWAGFRRGGSPLVAVGPGGERLYSIYVAPGADRRDSEETPEKKCQALLRQLLRNYPQRRPKPLPTLKEEAISMFPGLSESGFKRAYSRACDECNNHSWSKGGRPKKSPN